MISTEQTLRVSIALANSSLDAAAQRIRDESGGFDLRIASGLIGAEAVTDSDMETYGKAVDTAVQIVSDRYLRWLKQAKLCANTNTLIVELLKETSGAAAFLRSIDSREHLIMQDENDELRTQVAFRLVDYLFDRGLWFWTIPYTDQLYTANEDALADVIAKVEGWATDHDPFAVKCIDLMVDMEGIEGEDTSAVLALYVVKVLHDEEDGTGFYGTVREILSEVPELINEGADDG